MANEIIPYWDFLFLKLPLQDHSFFVPEDRLNDLSLADILRKSSRLLYLSDSANGSTSHLRFMGTGLCKYNDASLDKKIICVPLVLKARNTSDAIIEPMREFFHNEVYLAREWGVLHEKSNMEYQFYYCALDWNDLLEEDTNNRTPKKSMGKCIIFPQLYVALHKLSLMHEWFALRLSQDCLKLSFGVRNEVAIPSLSCNAIFIKLQSLSSQNDSIDSNAIVKIESSGGNATKYTGSTRVKECSRIGVSISLEFRSQNRVLEAAAPYFRQYLRNCFSELPALSVNSAEISMDSRSNTDKLKTIVFSSIELPDSVDNRKAFESWMRDCLSTALNSEGSPRNPAYAGLSEPSREASPPTGAVVNIQPDEEALPIQPLPPPRPSQIETKDPMSIASILNQDPT